MAGSRVTLATVPVNGSDPTVVTASPAGGVPAWASGVAYAINTLVTSGGNTYICATAHTSGATFSGESGDWQQVSGSGGGGSGVSSFNTRTGAVTLTKADVTGTGLAASDVGADASGAAATAQSNAEAVSLPRAGGTMSGAIAMGASKITGLANGSAASDAAAFGQIPAELPPNGSAGGDLSGTYPNPSVAKIDGIAVSGTPSSGQVLTATSASAADWQTPSGGGAVSSVFGRTGAVAATSGDYSVSEVTGAAPLASPALTGAPTAPTAAALTNDTQVATTAYADSAVGVEKARAEAAEVLKAPIASPTFTGTVTAPEFTASGLTGATAASRYVGATTSGAPTSGTFAVGDFVVDQTGAKWVCTLPGAPGAWKPVGSLPGLYLPAGWNNNFRAALANASSALARVVVAGDSLSRGYYSSNLDTKGMWALIASSLQTTYGDGGSGLRLVADTSAWATGTVNATAITDYVTAGCYGTTTGTWSKTGTGSGPGYETTLMTTAAGASITLSFRGTKLDIYTIANGNAPFTYSIDGAAAVAVADAGTYEIQVTTITGLSAGNHTVKITYNGNGTNKLYVVGVRGYNSTGVEVYNDSIYGIEASEISTGAFGGGDVGYDWLGGYKTPASLAVWSLFLNDIAASETTAACMGYAESWANAVRAGGATAQNGNTDMLFLIQHAGAYAPGPAYGDLMSRLLPLAEAYGAAIINLWALGRNSWTRWANAGYWANESSPGSAGTSSVHLCDAGHAYVAGVIEPLLIG